MTKIFVYGTLMNDLNGFDLKDECKFLGEATTRGSLYNLGWFPGVILDNYGDVHGQLWQVTDDILRDMDRYEGYTGDSNSSLFVPEEVTVTINNRKTKALIYIFNKAVKDKPRVEEGRWVVEESA